MACRRVPKLSSLYTAFFLFFKMELIFKAYDCHLVSEDMDLNIPICIHILTHLSGNIDIDIYMFGSNK